MAWKPQGPSPAAPHRSPPQTLGAPALPPRCHPVPGDRRALQTSGGVAAQGAGQRHPDGTHVPPGSGPRDSCPSWLRAPELTSLLAPGPAPTGFAHPGPVGRFPLSCLLAAAPTSLGPGPRALWALSGQRAWAQPCLPWSLGFPYFPRSSVFPSVRIGVNSLSPDPFPGTAVRTEDAELGVPGVPGAAGCGLPARTPSGRASAAAQPARGTCHVVHVCG